MKLKLNNLPQLKIKNPFGSIPKIAESQTFKYIKYVIYFVLAISVLTGALYLNVIREQVLYLQSKPTESVAIDEGLILDKTANIIVRDGNVEPDVAKKYAVWIYEASAKYSLDPTLLLSVMATESGFNYKAVSPFGAIGLLQIIPHYHKEKTTQAALFDPKHNIMVGAQIVREYMDRSKSTVETLLRYNGSVGQAPIYATKVINTQHKYDKEIMLAVTE